MRALLSKSQDHCWVWDWFQDLTELDNHQASGTETWSSQAKKRWTLTSAYLFSKLRNLETPNSAHTGHLTPIYLPFHCYRCFCAQLEHILFFFWPPDKFQIPTHTMSYSGGSYCKPVCKWVGRTPHTGAAVPQVLSTIACERRTAAAVALWFESHNASRVWCIWYEMLLRVSGSLLEG